MIATFPTAAAICGRRVWWFPAQFPANGAMLPRTNQRKISIDVFRLTHHGFGSAMHISLQVTDNKNA
jgi:hypothetical protein